MKSRESTKYENNRIFTLNNPQAPRLCPELAQEIGLNESILLLQLEFWIATTNHIYDDKKWTYQSIREIQKIFPFWGVGTIHRAIKSLEEKNLISIGDYNKFKYDKTKWFSLNYDEINNLKSIHINLFQNGTHLNQNGTGFNQNGTGFNQNGTTIPESSTDKSTESSTESASSNEEEIVGNKKEVLKTINKLKNSLEKKIEIATLDRKRVRLKERPNKKDFEIYFLATCSLNCVKGFIGENRPATLNSVFSVYKEFGAEVVFSIFDYSILNWDFLKDKLKVGLFSLPEKPSMHHIYLRYNVIIDLIQEHPDGDESSSECMEVIEL